MAPEDAREAGLLIRAQRWAALATLGPSGTPDASMVAYAPEANFSSLLLLLSELAGHTRNLQRTPAAGLVVSAPDTGGEDPQTLARISFKGDARPVTRDDPTFPSLREQYLARLPASERLFGFSDFILFRFVPGRARFVGGFARAHNLTPAMLAEIWDASSD